MTADADTAISSAPGAPPDDHETLRRLRRHRRKARNFPGAPAAGPGPAAADWIAARVGSWRFVLWQSTILIAWIALNVLAYAHAWDPYPFILLNLVLSFQAAYTAPIILMSQNRAADLDRRRAEEDYNVNLKAELEIETLHQKVDLLREREIARLVTLVETLEARLAGKTG